MNFHRDLTDRDLHAPSNEQVENNSAGIISKLRAVQFNGLGTNFLQIELGDGSTDFIRGITQDDISNVVGINTGFITALGILTDVDTTPFLVNDLLYAGPAGVLQTTPNGPVIAQILYVHATQGIIYVRIDGQPQTGTGFQSKAGVVAGASFAGSPKKYTVTFATAFADANYAIDIDGADSRAWSYESKTSAGFTINANAATVMAGEVSWKATHSGESI